jgi:hypothetical protein
VIISKPCFYALGSTENHNPDEKSTMSALLISVLTILEYQKGNIGTVEVAPEELIRCFQNYIVALSAEEISRKTDIKVEPPTLENIFRDDRQVKVHYTEGLLKNKGGM